MKLLKHNGVTIETHRVCWGNLQGNSPFTADTAVLSGYTDISSIKNWNMYGSDFLADYQDQQAAIKLEFYKKGWSALTNDEKDIVIGYYANPDLGTGSTQSAEQVTYLMSNSAMTQIEAEDYLTEVWYGHYNNKLENCKNRWGKAIGIAVKYLSFDDASDLFDTVELLVSKYLAIGRLGLDYGDSKDGIMDYIMSTNGFSGTGLEFNSYTLKKGTWETFKRDVEKELIPTDFWDEIKTYL